MKFIDPHIHVTSRTTDDYEAMAAAGVAAIIEPAFWLGQPRTNVGSFQDYFSSLVGFEKFRAAQFGIRHYCTIGLNSKEANNEALAEQVMELMPLFLAKENVVAVGEIGFDDMTAAEEKYLRIQLEMAKEVNLPILIHTPHRNKKQGTYRSMDIIEEHEIPPHMVVIDHNNEETCEEVLRRGYWTAFTIYPKTKMGNERMVEIVKKYGAERIIVDSSADWGVSDPLAVPKTGNLMLERGIPKEHVELTCYKNALAAYGQSGQFEESDWLSPDPIDQRSLFEGNSVLRGGQTPRVDEPEDDRIIQ
ncbi:TatD family hydrolase [Blastopirellula marina]|uniref:Hydrolase TatD n=1 Tax=Blastopirellula marina TaxID=124 RepID=A0A2S8F9A0_9BACT|nr:TatD family hydrolase [Blastopirellula marina]PQO28731.1 hydrolase TatD [Blastopirellula marina]PTL42004.1 hydrolase TatD [Blastopirellula marina]